MRLIVQVGEAISLRVGEASNPPWSILVQAAVDARKKSFAAANPLALGVGAGMSSRAGGSGLQTPLGWITGKFTGVGAR